MVQSIEKINLYALVKDNDTIKISHYPETSFQGWTVEEILREIMNLGDEVRSDKYMVLINQLQDALQKGDARQAKNIFSELSNILHPSSIDRELIPLQIEGIRDNEHD